MKKNTQKKVYPKLGDLLAIDAANARKATLNDMERQKAKKNRPNVELGALVRTLPGGRHGIFASNVGLLRKPLY